MVKNPWGYRKISEGIPVKGYEHAIVEWYYNQYLIWLSSEFFKEKIRVTEEEL